MKCNIPRKRLLKKCSKIMWNKKIKKKNKWRYKSNMAQKSRNVINDKIIHEKKKVWMKTWEKLTLANEDY